MLHSIDWAIFKDDFTSIKVLIEAKADVIQDEEGRPPLAYNFLRQCSRFLYFL